MSVSPNLITVYGAANMVSGDSLTTGGAVTFSTRIGFSDFSSTMVGAWLSSSSSDTAVSATVIGRDGTGAVISETTTVNGLTPASGSTSWQRLLQGSITTAVGDVAFLSSTHIVAGTAQGAGNTSGATAPYLTAQSGQGASCAVENVIVITNNTPSGASGQIRRITAINSDTLYVNKDWGTTPSSSTTYTVFNGMCFEKTPNAVTKIIRIFDNCAADAVGGSSRTFYGKAFVVNNSTTTASTAAGMTISSTTPALPAGATLEFGWASGTFNDTATITNRQTFPTSVTLSSGSLPVSSGVPGGGNLAPGTAPNTAGALGLWMALTLPAGSQPYDGFASIQVSGTTT
jgi:hypothetical protein